MSEHRWERERAAWVLARAGHRPGARRRGEKLAVVARRNDRYEAGAGDAGFAEVTTRPLLYRAIFREEGAANTAGWALLTLIGGMVVAVLAGPALIISRAAYGTWWVMVRKWGRMTPAPYLLMSAVLGVVAWLVLSTTGLEGGALLAARYAGFQVVGGVAWAAWLVRANGWTAVARKQKRSKQRIAPIVVETEAPAVPVAVDDPEHEESDDEPVGIAPIVIEVETEVGHEPEHKEGA